MQSVRGKLIAQFNKTFIVTGSIKYIYSCMYVFIYIYIIKYLYLTIFSSKVSEMNILIFCWELL